MPDNNLPTIRQGGAGGLTLPWAAPGGFTTGFGPYRRLDLDLILYLHPPIEF